MKRHLNNNASALVSVALMLARFAAAQAQQPAPDPLVAWFDRIAQQQLQQREQAIAGASYRLKPSSAGLFALRMS